MLYIHFGKIIVPLSSLLNIKKNGEKDIYILENVIIFYAKP